MNVMIGFENGEKAELSDCSKFEVQAGGELCTIWRESGKVVLNFRKVLYIGENTTLGDTEKKRTAAGRK